MPQNLSLKFSINERDHARLLRQVLFRTAKVKTREQIVRIHYDTRTLQLAERAVEVSLRRLGPSWQQTVLHRDHSTNPDSLVSEWSVPYFNHFDFAVVEHSKLRDWLSQRKIIARMAPIFESSIRRASWQLLPSPGVVVLAKIDRGMLVSSGRRELVADLELFLVEGCREDLYSVATQLAARVSLTPQLLTKTERGCRLFLNSAPTPSKADSFTFPADALPLQAFQRIALACLRHMQENHAGAVATNDPEYIHQMRVATRRLRAAIQIFKPLMPVPFIERIISPLRDLMQILGRVRDLDVLSTEIVNPVVVAMRDEPGIVTLSAVITDRLYQARGVVMRILLEPGYGGLQLQAAAMLNLPPFVTTPTSVAEQASTLGGDMMALPRLKEFAQSRLRSLLNKMLESSARARIDNPASLHRMRISIKRLRYAMEFFRPMMPKKQGGKMLRVLADAQEKLGKLNDLAIAGEVLMTCVSNDRNLHIAVSLIGSWHAQRHADLLADVVVDIKKIERLKLPRFE